MIRNLKSEVVAPFPGTDRRKFLISSGALIGSAFLSGPLLAACTASDNTSTNKTTAKGGALTLAIVGTLTSLDPPLINTVTFGSVVVPHVLQTLLNLTPSGGIEPMLAESFDVADDGVTWTMHLRKNVLFHDGSPWTAEVAKANLVRYLGNPTKFARPQQYAFMTDFEAVDESTFQFKTKTPNSGTSHWLAWYAMAMHSGDALKKYGDDVAIHGIGTGPFKVKKFIANQTFELVRNDEYWGSKALLDSLNILNVPDPNGRATIVESGQAQASLGVPAAAIPTIKSNGSLKFIDAPSVRLVYIGLNSNNPVLSDQRVRQAMNYAVDADAIRKSVMLGYAEPIESVMPREVKYFKAQAPYSYDVAKAKSLLDEAGWIEGTGGIRAKAGKPLAVEIRTTNGYYSGDRATCEAVQQYLQAVGIKVQLTVVEHDPYFAYLLDPKNASTTSLNYGTYGGAIVDPTQNLKVFQSDLKASGVTGYFQRYSNPQYDAAYHQLVSSVGDEGKMKAAAEDAQLIAWEGAPWIFLFSLNQLAAASSKVSGLQLTVAEGFDLTKVKID